MSEPKAPPGAQWAGRYLDDFGVHGAVTESGVAVIWWPARPDLDWHVGSDSETKGILRAWALHERGRADKIAKAAKAHRVACEDVWLGAIGTGGPSWSSEEASAKMEALRAARRVTEEALRALGVDP